MFLVEVLGKDAMKMIMTKPLDNTCEGLYCRQWNFLELIAKPFFSNNYNSKKCHNKKKPNIVSNGFLSPFWVSLLQGRVHLMNFLYTSFHNCFVAIFVISIRQLHEINV